MPGYLTSLFTSMVRPTARLSSCSMALPTTSTAMMLWHLSWPPPDAGSSCRTSGATALTDALGITRATLAGYDWGGRAACVVAALHPERVSGLVSAGTGYNVQDMSAALEPGDLEAEQRHWYWFYLSTQRGAAALTEDCAGFCRHLWRTFSPSWKFDEDTYAQTSVSFDNPDFVAVVLHSYRYRIGAAPGDPALDAIERQLSDEPPITVPAIVLEGDHDGVDPPAPAEKVAPLFTALRRQTVLKGIGHNVPQEAPRAFVDAIEELGT